MGQEAILLLELPAVPLHRGARSSLGWRPPRWLVAFPGGLVAGDGREGRLSKLNSIGMPFVANSN